MSTTLRVATGRWGRWGIFGLALGACLLLATLGGGCLGLQDVRDYCVDAQGQPNGNCPTCERDEQCVIVSNACHSTAACVHVDVELAVNQIGCNLEYDVPSDDVCRCQQGLCRSD